MKRLLRIAVNSAVFSFIPILSWFCLGLLVDKNLANVFTLTYPLQFIWALLKSIFGTGANISKEKDKDENAVLSGMTLGIIVGFIIFGDKLTDLSYTIVDKVRGSKPYTVLIVLAIICIVTVIIKAIFGEGTPLKGGMPSGHSALAFALATIISLITVEPICIVVSYLMAIITAQSRVDSEVHTVWEVIVGGLMGIILPIFIFTLFGV